MILINKITPFTTDSFQKDLTECLLKNSDNSFISNIVVFSNTPIVLPKNNKVKLIIKNSYSDYDIIEYTKRLYKDEIIIFANPFAIFNNSLIHLERNTSVLKNNDYYLFNRNQKLLQGESIDDLFTNFSTNEKIVVQRKQIWTKEIKSQTNIIKSIFTPKISKENRNKILAATDFLVSVSDANITQQEKDSVLEYRESLRNITDISILTADNFEEYFVENKSVPSLSDIFPAPPECIRDIVGQVFTR